MKVSVKSQALANINTENYPKFTFKINNAEFVTDVVTAEIMSPVVSSIRRTDSSVNTISLDLKKHLPRSNHKSVKITKETIESSFHKLVDLHRGKECEYTYPELRAIRAICSALGNTWVEIGEPEGTPANADNFVYHLNLFEAEDAIKYAAEHIDKIPLDNILKIEAEPFKAVLNSPFLKCTSENTLFDVIEAFITEYGVGHANLLGSVVIEFLDEDHRTRFTQIVEDALIRVLGNQIFDKKFASVWKAIATFVNNPSAHSVMSSFVAESKPVTISASSNINQFSYASNLLSPSRSYGWTSKEEGSHHVVYAFPDPVSIDAYELWPRGNSDDMKSWCVDVSEDGEIWRTVDTQSNNRALESSDGHPVLFKLKEETGPFYRLRIRMLGTNLRGKNKMQLLYAEFYNRRTVYVPVSASGEEEEEEKHEM